MKLYTYLVLVGLLVATSIFGSNDKALTKYNYPWQLDKAMNTLATLPEGRDLLNKATRRGAIEVIYNDVGSDSFGGMWDGNRRTITIHRTSNPDLTSQLQTLVIELHNAMESGSLNRIWQQASENTIDKESFVRKAEQWEHNNLLKARDLLALGAARGLFPKNAPLHAYDDFESYFLLQQIGGHSQWYAQAYDTINPANRHIPFRGTIANLQDLSGEDKLALRRYVRWRNDVISKSDSAPITSLSNEIAKLRSDEIQAAGSQRKQWIKQLFQELPEFKQLLGSF